MNGYFATSTVASMTVSCIRCGAPAAAVMTFDYTDGAVWMDDVVEPIDTFGYLFCSDHADRMTPPLGWTLTDRRTVTRLFAPVQVA